ncbi:hypothetical protein EX30DRAFT_121492 [Ascodesmis nigricans]|uniref:Uncharacterized protein n=1 Tax=Ascodesmis nigricans TaxID=341454 RepID=A0A4S2MSK1_9PEZI|nr:hypothetical protein EX30DRAFT_121492 [Ascodesmis nigricans]
MVRLSPAPQSPACLWWSLCGCGCLPLMCLFLLCVAVELVRVSCVCVWVAVWGEVVPVLKKIAEFLLCLFFSSCRVVLWSMFMFAAVTAVSMVLWNRLFRKPPQPLPARRPPMRAIKF